MLRSRDDFDNRLFFNESVCERILFVFWALLLKQATRSFISISTHIMLVDSLVISVEIWSRWTLSNLFLYKLLWIVLDAFFKLLLSQLSLLFLRILYVLIRRWFLSLINIILFTVIVIVLIKLAITLILLITKIIISIIVPVMLSSMGHLSLCIFFSFKMCLC